MTKRKKTKIKNFTVVIYRTAHKICTIFLKENTPETDFKNFQSGKNQ